MCPKALETREVGESQKPGKDREAARSGVVDSRAQILDETVAGTLSEIFSAKVLQG